MHTYLTAFYRVPLSPMYFCTNYAKEFFQLHGAEFLIFYAYVLRHDLLMLIDYVVGTAT